MSYPSVSIIFPNYNGGKVPLNCIRSIYSLNYPQKKLEIIVVDNHSTDGSDVQIRLKYPRVKLLKQNINLGFSRAINLGIKSSTGDCVFVTNDDLLFSKNSLTILVEYLRDHPGIGALGGKIYSQKFKNRISSAGFMMNRITGDVYSAPCPDTIKQPDWIQGCAMLIPKKIFEKSGFLDENYEYFFEDFDLCLRIKRSGYKIFYIPDAVFWHGGSVTANKNLSEKYYHWYKSKIRFILINMPVLNILSIMLIQIMVIFGHAVIFRNDKFVAFLKGLLWNIGHLRQTLKFRPA